MLLRWGEFQRAIDTTREIMNDPKTLKPFAKRMRERAKAFVEGQGDGAWAPPAASTVKKWERTGTSDITRHGRIRVDKIRHVEKQIKAMLDRAGKSGWGDADRKKIVRLKKRAAVLRAAGGKPQADAEATAAKATAAREQEGALAEKLREEHKQPNKKGSADRRQKMLARLEKLATKTREADAAAKWAEIGTTYKGRNIGESEAHRGRKLMPRMPGTIRAKSDVPERNVLRVTVYSKAGKIGYLHHMGQANRAPKRTIVPQANEADLDFAAHLLEGKCADAWKG